MRQNYFAASTPALTKQGQRRQPNKCAVYIKQELTRRYEPEELACGRVAASKRKYKEVEIATSALSPNRLREIITQARKIYKEDFDKLPQNDLNEIINSKCRQVKMKLKSKAILDGN